MMYIIEKVCDAEQIVFDFGQYENADEADFTDIHGFYASKEAKVFAFKMI